MRKLAMCLGTALLLSSGVNADVSGYVFGVGGKPFICVPENVVPEYNRDITYSSLSIVPKSGVPHELFTFNFFEPEVVRDIAGFAVNPQYRADDPPNTIFGYIGLVDSNYKRIPLGGAAGPDAVNIWNRTPPCMQPVIVKVPGSTDYLAKCDRANFWHILFDRLPGSGPRPANIYESVLAECNHTSIGFGPHKGAELDDCIRRIDYQNFRVDYHFEIENAGVIPKMDAFIRSKIDSWSRRCSSAPAK